MAVDNVDATNRSREQAELRRQREVEQQKMQAREQADREAAQRQVEEDAVRVSISSRQSGEELRE